MMYQFRDTTDNSEITRSLPAEAVSIAGRYLEDIVDGYRTLYVKGRESLGVEIDSFSVGVSDGSTVKGLRYPSRTLVVGFRLEAANDSEFRASFNQLNNILAIEEADFIFNDEPDKYFSGTPIFNATVEAGRNCVTGEWEIFCAYPFKRSVELVVLDSTDAEVAELDDTSATFEFEYKGTRPARPVLRAEFTAALEGGDYSEDGDCGYVAFMDSEENIIQLGNPEIIDLDQYASAAQLVNREFSSVEGWEQSGGSTYDDKTITGSISLGNITDQYWNKGEGQTVAFAKPVYNTGDGWHGAILHQTTEGAINFTLSVVHRLCAHSDGQTGCFECGVYNSTDDVMVAGFVIEKTGAGSNGTVKYILNGVEVGRDGIDLSYYNTHFGYCKRTAVYGTETYYDPVYHTEVVKVCVRKKTKKKKAKYKKVTKTWVEWVAKTRTVQTGWVYTQSNLNSTIQKSGSSVTFKIGNLGARTFQSKLIELKPAHRVSMYFGQLGSNGAMGTNAVHSVKFTREPSVSFAEIPNVFTAGDIVEADCNDATVYIMRKNTVSGQYTPQYGALGNDWEDFVINPGNNLIRAVWSEWVAPEYKPHIQIIFNEVYI